ncbi:MAG: hypothetical protein FJY42_12700 [Betaproteobacteria bacterium]|nr:hypothetical protein [Betaproteobacteria bacterium]
MTKNSIYLFPVILCGLLASVVHATPVALISPVEAQMPDAKVSITRGITRGPGIRVLSPTDVKADSFALKIGLESRGGAKVDPKSVRVEYLKEPAVDLTPRIQTAVKPDQIDLPSVRVPRGVHLLRVTVTDSEGRVSSSVVRLNAD